MLLLFTTLLFFCLPVFANDNPTHPEYVGSEQCKSCHETQYENWQKSHHSEAWLTASPQNTLGDFNNKSLETTHISYLFTQDNEGFFISLDNQQGELQRYPVLFTAGITPLQQYLIDTGNGKLQVPDVAWDVINKRWFHLYPEQDTSAGNGMHWTGSYKNWNARCAECHATDFKKNYDPKQKAYHSTQSEIGVGCEACHGPGQAHLQWAEKPAAFNRGLWSDVTKSGLPDTFTKEPSSIINLCSGCHSRREAFNADSPPPGSDFDNNYRLSLLTDGQYFADGQIHDEVYVLGSFKQSKMYQRGVSCLNCHDAHSYQVKLQGNQLCTQCHSPQGNPDFPSLSKKNYDSDEHHFHRVDSEGAQCVACHMPARNYMLVDSRRDHSFKIPRPDLSLKFTIPNACTGCHQDKTDQWAADSIQQHYPQGRHLQPHFAEAFYTARTKPGFSTAKQLLNIASDLEQAEIVRASAVDHLRYVGANNGSREQLQKFLQDTSPLVRSATVRLIRQTRPELLVELTTPLLADENRIVRVDAAIGLLSTDLQTLPADQQTALGNASRELQQSLLNRADFPENQLVTGGIALTMKNLPAAKQAFSEAVNMDPQLVQAWRMLALIQAAQGDNEGSRATLQQALTHNPDNEILSVLMQQTAE